MKTHEPTTIPTAIEERITLLYKGNIVNGVRLNVFSKIPTSIHSAWENVQTPALLQFIAKGFIRFKSTQGNFPKKWEVGKTYGAKMFILGFLPFGGIHYLHIEKVDSANFSIATKEWDTSAKVWNHDVIMKALDSNTSYYEDAITIYGDFMTPIITAFAKQFYKHRQKRWQIVAEKKLQF